MLPADGSGTAWSSMSMDEMRALIKNPDTSAYYQMLGGWKQSYELLNAHKWQVQSYRDALEAVWPTGKSAAAKAYVDRLNEMLTNLDQTYEASMANYGAFADAALSISLAQSDFDKIDQEYAKNQTLLSAFETQTAQAPATDQKAAPPVADGRQEQLRLQAAARLSGVSTDLAQAQVRLVRPTKYALPPVARDETQQDPNGAGAAPPIPPITPTYTDHDAAVNKSTRPSITFPGGSGNGGPSPTVPTTPAPVGPHPGVTPPVINTQQPGLVLGGTGTPVATPPAIGANPPPPALNGGGTGPFTSTNLPSVTPPVLPPGKVSGGLPRTSTGRAQGLSGEQVLRPTGVPEGIRALPPGGMIGGPSSGSRAQSARPGMRRVNPVGGMIGEEPPSTRAGGQKLSPYVNEPMAGGGRSAAGTAGGRGVGGGMSAGERGRGVASRGSALEHSYGQTNGRRTNQQNDDEDLRWDPDNPWETAEGVDPVLMPSHEQRIDPGPAIGLP